MRYLITGGCGFLGSNLAARVLADGHELVLLDNLARSGSHLNWAWLRSHGAVELVQADVCDYESVLELVRRVQPDVIFHLAGQVAMTTSIADPHRDFLTNVAGGHNVLEAVRRHAPECIIVYSSTNKVYGDLDHIRFEESATRFIALEYPNGFDETLPLDFRSPYGCSKGAVDQYMLDYARTFGIRTVVFRHSSIFGGRQFSTYDQGWVGWFMHCGLAQRDAAALPFTISGNGKQVRDILFADDLADCYRDAVRNIDRAAGYAFNIGGGQENSLSLLELFAWIEEALDVRLRYERLPPRQSDQKVFVADTTKAESFFGWRPRVHKTEALAKMLNWLQNQ